jgi:NAD(P)-dependent dehydrogenase (short-subunit alcohol dehydrogenase family)
MLTGDDPTALGYMAHGGHGCISVTANVVSPGSTRTAILEASAQIYGLESGEAFASQQPINRLITPEEIAASIAWLCTPSASAVTGADVAVDGGMTVR